MSRRRSKYARRRQLKRQQKPDVACLELCRLWHEDSGSRPKTEGSATADRWEQRLIKLARSVRDRASSKGHNAREALSNWLFDVCRVAAEADIEFWSELVAMAELRLGIRITRSPQNVRTLATPEMRR